jgi:hypothetical protein
MAIIPVVSATARAGCSIARRPKMASLRKPTVSVPRVTRHATAWDQAAATCAPAPRPGAAGQAATVRSTSQPSTRVGILTSLARRSRGPAAQGLRGIAHPRKRPPTWRRAYPRSSADARPPKSAASTKHCTNSSASRPLAALMVMLHPLCL